MKKWEGDMDIVQILYEYDNMFGIKTIDEIELFLTEKIETALGEQDYSASVTLLNEMLGLCRESGQKDKGIEYSRKLLALIDGMGIAETVGYATTLLNIANMYRVFGITEQALGLYRKAESIYHNKLPENAFDYASLYNNWSLLYQEKREYTEAVQMLERARSIVDMYPEAVIEQATTRTNLASVLLKKSQTEQDREKSGALWHSAMEYLRHAIESFEREGGEDFHYSAALAAMGDGLYISCRYREAAVYYTKAMEKLEKYVGRSYNYKKVEEKYKKALEKESHIDRCRDFYERYGAPAIHEKFSEYESRIAVGIVGEGSDCFGYDDEISRDHDYATGFCMWLMEEDYQCMGASLQKEYERLFAEHAKEYDGRTSSEDVILQDAYISGRRGVFEIKNFYQNILRISVSEDSFLEENRQWLSVKEENLAAAVNGEVFRDDQGVFSAIREKIMNYYPKEVWRRRLAAQIHIFSQNGQYNYARMMARKDYVTAEICIAQALESAMAIVYLLNRTYAPYYKWKRKGLRSLSVLPELGDLLDEIAETNDQKSAWDNVVYSSCAVNVNDKKIKCIERISGLILEELNRQKIVEGENRFLDVYCRKIIGGDNK